MMQLGPFTVECSRFPHIPVPGMAEAPHAVYWISAAGKSIYVTADAQMTRNATAPFCAEDGQTQRSGTGNICPIPRRGSCCWRRQ